MKKLLFALVAVFVGSVWAEEPDSPACRIGTTDYSTLQEAFDYLGGHQQVATIKLLRDVDITSRVVVPKLGQKMMCTIDGDGHMIRQAAACQLFYANADFINVTFTNVTVVGGGEACKTSDSQKGAFFDIAHGASSLILEAGCVISNFVMHSVLIGDAGALSDWNINVKPGSVIAHNTATGGCGIFRADRFGDSYSIQISGGEIYGNKAPSSTLAWFSALSEKRTKPMLVISGGRIHDNVVTGKKEEEALVYCDYGPLDISVTGGEIYDNDATVFFFLRTQPYLSRVRLSGGRIYGNAGYAVYDNQGAHSVTAEDVLSMFLSGDAVVAGNGSDGRKGLHCRNEFKYMPRFALDGDFSGFAYLSGDNASETHAVGKTYGTNLLDYAGAENVRQAGSTRRALQTDAETGLLKWQDFKAAKIGATQYDTLAAALAAAADGATITILNDCICTTALVPPANKAITIDGGGHRVFRAGNISLVDATAAGGNLTLGNVELNQGYYVHPEAYTNETEGLLVNTTDGVAATVTLGPGVRLVGGKGAKSLVHVARGATVNLDGAVAKDQPNRAILADAGATLNIRGATEITGNAAGDIEVADGTVLVQNGDFTGAAHVTVGGVEPYDGQRFGSIDGDHAGFGNFVNPGAERIYVSADGGVLKWFRRGLMLIFR